MALKVAKVIDVVNVLVSIGGGGDSGVGSVEVVNVGERVGGGKVERVKGYPELATLNSPSPLARVTVLVIVQSTLDTIMSFGQEEIGL